MTTEDEDGAVLVIETLPLPVTLRYLEALFPPQPFYLLVIDLPAQYLHIFVDNHELRGTVIGGQDSKLIISSVAGLENGRRGGLGQRPRLGGEDR
jgi:hypothetical protein